MRGELYKILFVLVFIWVDISSSFDNGFYANKYDDSTRTLRRNYIGGYESKYTEIKRSNVPKELDVRMPDVSPQKPETYFCTARKLPEDDAYIVGYEPHAKMQTAHHMLMFGCDDVDDAGSKGFWNCNEMGGTCKGSVNKIMYAWAMDAPPLALPQGVGFHVGGSSQIRYIVLQVHYANVDKFKLHHETDHSGVTLRLQREKPKYFAGIYLVAAGGPPIPPKEKEFDMNMGCKYTVGPQMHPFAFRVHTHKLGYVVTGYRVRQGKWHLIGKGDPRQPQAFYHVDSEESLVSGDALAARCTYNSMKRDHTTFIGPTRADEMCNFYLMYWYDPAEGVSSDACEFVTFKSSDYPPGTDEPLHVKQKMDLKRDMDDFDESILNSDSEEHWN